LPAEFFLPTWRNPACAGRLHGGMPLLRPLGQRLPTELAHTLYNRALGLITSIERAGAILHFVEQRRHLFVQLWMALQARHQIHGVFK